MCVDARGVRPVMKISQMKESVVVSEQRRESKTREGKGKDGGISNDKT